MVHKTRKKKRSYSKGNLNLIIDAVVHPLCEQNNAFIAIDAALHGLVEQNPSVTIRKFARYTLPEIIEKLFKNP